ncbi:MAG: STAS domain-containing protein [Magnetococcales bacterium]|nr:STAS domain-containing protein [Magnetococcales bacterium]
MIEELDSRIILRLPEEFNFKTHREFRECYCHRDPRQSYKIDFRAVTNFDSAALGMLLLLRSHCGDDKADIHLSNCSPRIMKIMEIAKFGIYFQIE